MLTTASYEQATTSVRRSISRPLQGSLPLAYIRSTRQISSTAISKVCDRSPTHLPVGVGLTSNTAANVMIHEEGGLQIIDFGVAGIVESKLDKRGTIVGTPHWMPPEHHKNWNGGLKYGFEVRHNAPHK